MSYITPKFRIGKRSDCCQSHMDCVIQGRCLWGNDHLECTYGLNIFHGGWTQEGIQKARKVAILSKRLHRKCADRGINSQCLENFNKVSNYVNGEE